MNNSGYETHLARLAAIASEQVGGNPSIAQELDMPVGVADFSAGAMA